MVYESRWLFGWKVSMKRVMTWCTKHHIDIEALLYDPSEYEEFIPSSVQFVYARPYECDMEDYTIGIHLQSITGTLDSFQDISGETIEEAQTFAEQFTSYPRVPPQLYVMVHHT